MPLDVDERAVANTLDNAFRNDVSDRVTGARRRPLPVGPGRALRGDRRDASRRRPTDPIRPASSHRPIDYWGRGAASTS